jgi:hypothetical protein
MTMKFRRHHGWYRISGGQFLSTRSFRVLDYTPSHVAKIDSEMTASHHMKMVTGGAADFLQVLKKIILI